MPNNNLLMESQRHKFLRSANNVELNNYFKRLQELAKMKGGNYQNMYDEDLNFMIRSFEEPNVGQIGGFFTGIRSRLSPDPLARVYLLKEGTYCPIITQGSFISDDCRTRAGEMDMITKIITRAHSGKVVGPFLGLVVRRFVELLFCCSQTWYKNQLRREEIKDVALKIGNSPVLISHAKDIIKPLLDVEPNMYVYDYVELRKKMKPLKKEGPEYAKLKEQKNKMIESQGVDKLYATKLIDFMIHESIKDDDL